MLSWKSWLAYPGVGYPCPSKKRPGQKTVLLRLENMLKDDAWHFWHGIVNWLLVSVVKKLKTIHACTHTHALKHFACTLYKIHQDIAKELHVLRPVISRFGVGDARPMWGLCVRVLLQIGVLKNACKEGLRVYLPLFCTPPTQNSEFFLKLVRNRIRRKTR